jgi:hypothetical protein
LWGLDRLWRGQEARLVFSFRIPNNGFTLCEGWMIELFLKSLGYILTAMFVVGLAGCIFVIPITAKRLFSVLFEKDLPGER